MRFKSARSSQGVFSARTVPASSRLRSWLVAAGAAGALASAPAFATITANSDNGGINVTLNSVPSVVYAAASNIGDALLANSQPSPAPTPSFFIDTSDASFSYKAIYPHADLASLNGADDHSSNPNLRGTNMVMFDITSTATSVTVSAGQQLALQVLLYPTGGGTTGAVPVPIAWVGSTNDQGSDCVVNSNAQCQLETTSNNSYGNLAYAVNYTAGSTIRIGLYPEDMCYAFYQTGTAGSGCNPSSPTAGNYGPQVYQTGSTPPAGITAGPQQMKLQFVITAISTTQAANTVPTSPIDSLNFDLVFSADDPGQVTCSLGNPSTVYTPGDLSITLTTSSFGGSTSLGSLDAPFQELIVLADKVPTSSTSPTTLDLTQTLGDNIVQRVPLGPGRIDPRLLKHHQWQR